MRSAILMMLLAGASTGAVASWIELRKDERENVAILADPDSVRRIDNFVRMWILFDYGKAQVVGNQNYMSERTQEEYDCKEARFRVLNFSDHSENMAGGKVVLRTSMPGDWASVEPGTVNEFLWKVACAK